MKLVNADYTACPHCGGGMPHEVDDDLVCRCGTAWADPATVDLLHTAWEDIGLMLWVRASGRCEIRSDACLGWTNGDLRDLPKYKVSIHHRRPRGMGGTKRADVHSLAWLILACGDGTTGCHGYVEHHGKWAEDRGLKVPKAMNDPDQWPLTLPSGRRVLLDPNLPWYQPVTDGLPYAV